MCEHILCRMINQLAIGIHEQVVAYDLMMSEITPREAVL